LVGACSGGQQMKIELYNKEADLIATLFSPVALDSMIFKLNGKLYSNYGSPVFVFSNDGNDILSHFDLEVVKYIVQEY
jgi:hypothetical protein